VLKLKIYDGHRPNTKQLRLRTNGYEEVDLAFFILIFQQLHKIRATGYKVYGLDGTTITELMKEVLEV